MIAGSRVCDKPSRRTTPRDRPAASSTILKKDRVISLIQPDNRASIRVAKRLGQTLQGRIDHFGREMLCYGIDRETYARFFGLARPAPEAGLGAAFFGGRRLAIETGCS